MKTKLVIFDFDGTIADNKDVLMKASNDVLEELGYPRLNQAQIDEIRMSSPAKALEIANFPKYKIPVALKKLRQKLNAGFDKVKPVEGIIEEIHRLNKTDVVLALLTSNSSENVRPFLRKYEIYECFEIIKTGSSFFGKSRHLKKIVKRFKIQPDQVVYVGDEMRDVEAAKRAGIRSISVTWGANHEKAFSHSTATKVVTKPNSLNESIGLITNY